MKEYKLKKLAKKLAKRHGITISEVVHMTSNFDVISFMKLYRSELLGDVWSYIVVCIEETTVTANAQVRMDKLFIDARDFKEYNIALNRATGVAAELAKEIGDAIR